VYHSVDNSLEYHGEEPQYLEISFELAPAVERLICSYPDFIKVSELPLDSEEQKVTSFSLLSSFCLLYLTIKFDRSYTEILSLIYI
jgi:lysine-specific demethylase/histidyl-hydroxylase NO66